MLLLVKEPVKPLAESASRRSAAGVDYGRVTRYSERAFVEREARNYLRSGSDR